MKIGIVGPAFIVGVLADRLTKLGHSLAIAHSRGPGTLVDVATRTGTFTSGAARAPASNRANSSSIVLAGASCTEPSNQARSQSATPWAFCNREKASARSNLAPPGPSRIGGSRWR